MEIKKTINEDVLLVEVNGSFDTVNSPLFDEQTKDIPASVKTIEIDCSGVTYLSSAGLRSLVNLYKRSRGTSEIVISHVPEQVKEVFDITGFGGIFSFK